ncbi:hypothetical protein [Bacillus sp. FJAT-45350]|uniref:hypothetical protein n=1 Tax=Bacillus sp. FJAT-45350 TaxID=2011014 RepID=UPI000BB6918B|nr:hypothetical protein [Bacillus sp. FJAT-45350]
MLNYKEQLKLIEHGRNLEKNSYVEELEKIFKSLANRKGIGEKTMQIIYEEFGVEWQDDK